MRGKVQSNTDGLIIKRITPAYAGKSIIHHSRTFVKRDHPRLCGEKAPIHTDRACFLGSPPPMRGKATFWKMQNVKFRITPAYAGKSFCIKIETRWIQDHPRLCGEKTTYAAKQYKELGSPPPMRGKVSLIPNFRRHIGITPAYAGKRCPLVRAYPPF